MTSPIFILASVASNIIAALKTNTLILVHSRQLLEQWKERLNQFLVFDESLYDNIKPRGRKKEKHIIGQLGGGKNTLNGIIDIAIMQSINRKNTINDIVKNYGLVIVDECHHIPALSFESILREVNAKYVYGLTATPIRKDGHHPIIFMQCGPIRYHVDAKSEANKRPFNHYIVPKFTPFKLPRIDKAKEVNISTLFTELYQNEPRNKLIYKDIITAYQEGRNSIVITERTDHLDLLYEYLIDKIDNIITLSGQLTKKQRELAIEKLKSIQNSNFTILATGRYIGEGFDEPRLDTLFLTMPVSWKGTIAQYAGRLHRLIENKKDVIIYDYVDIHISVLDKMYQKRLR